MGILQKYVSEVFMLYTPCESCDLKLTLRNSPDFLTLERSRGMGLHLTKFRDALFSFVLQTLTCSFLYKVNRLSCQLFPDKAL